MPNRGQLILIYYPFIRKVKTMSIRIKYVLLAIAILLLPAALCFAAAPASAATVPASHKEIESIGLDPESRFGNLTTFCMTSEGNLLACDTQADEIRKISPEGKTLARWKPGFAPYSIFACPDGTIYAAGSGVVAKLDENGKILKSVKSDGDNFPQGRSSGITATKKDVFVNIGFGWSLRSLSSVVRFDRDLNKAKTIAEGLRGCCQRLDVVAKDGFLYIAENSRFRVLKCDRDGNVLSKWGQRNPRDIEGFGSCCNPMNLCFGPKGELFTAESGLGRVKRYTPDGKFLGLVGYVGVERFTRAGRTAASCSNISIAVSKDKSRIYVLDFKNKIIRVMARADAKS